MHVRHLPSFKIWPKRVENSSNLRPAKQSMWCFVITIRIQKQISSILVIIHDKNFDLIQKKNNAACITYYCVFLVMISPTAQRKGLFLQWNTWKGIWCGQNSTDGRGGPVRSQATWTRGFTLRWKVRFDVNTDYLTQIRFTQLDCFVDSLLTAL